MTDTRELVERLRQHAQDISDNVTNKDEDWPEIGLMREAADALDSTLSLVEAARVEEREACALIATSCDEAAVVSSTPGTSVTAESLATSAVRMVTSIIASAIRARTATGKDGGE